MKFNNEVSSTLLHNARALFNTNRGLPNEYSKGITPFQAVRLSEKCGAFNENILNMNSEVAAYLLTMNNVGKFNMLIDLLSDESLSLTEIYLIIIISMIASDEDDFILTLNNIVVCDNDIEEMYLNVSELCKPMSDFEVTPVVQHTKTHSDDRGEHSKFFIGSILEESGFNQVSEIFTTKNNYGTLRGMHRQLGEHTQQKVIKVMSGRFNVRVLLNVNYMKSYRPYLFNEDVVIENYNDDFLLLSYDNVDENSDPIFIPIGSYLGYVSLEDNSKMLYICDNDFNSNEDDGVNPITSEIDWNFNGDDFILSERDLLGESMERGVHSIYLDEFIQYLGENGIDVSKLNIK